MIRKSILSIPFLFISFICFSQESSIARVWNDILLDAIRNDFARPTVHARNLFHSSVAMYDSWAIYNETAESYLIGKEINGFESDFDVQDVETLLPYKDLEKTISYAMYRIIDHRYSNSPKFHKTKLIIDSFMLSMNYDVTYTSSDYMDQNPASLGNFIALEIIKYGLNDGSNEQHSYENTFYQPVNDALDPTISGINEDIDPNRWQPLFFNIFIDQSGNPLPESTPSFLGPEWGLTESFALEEFDKTKFVRDGNAYPVYLDPGEPPYLIDENSKDYKWGYSLVLEWSSHLDPKDNIEIDISPASIGNVTSLPNTSKEYRAFYKSTGGDNGIGRSINPKTDEPYDPQIVLRADYTRVLAEFWADGPDSETPPGHWFSILNYVMDNPDFNRKYGGKNPVLSSLEYEVKAYFMLSGALHDSAIASWSVKGYYDYIRPISAIRYMAAKGQSSNSELPSYNPLGITLIPNIIEVIETGDPDFPDLSNIGNIKIRTWKGPIYIDNPAIDVSGVDWILAADWWPYQRPSFVTPPFAGYVSGHSTFSRSAAEILTYLTGDEYFPGGLGSFVAPKNEFLVFEEGPTNDIVLQWATYRDASDQCSLSRIWGGIHPPADDIPGRKMGEIIGFKAIRKANEYFNGQINKELVADQNKTIIYPNPSPKGSNIKIEIDGVFDKLYITNQLHQVISTQEIDLNYKEISTKDLPTGLYFIVLKKNNFKVTRKLIIY